MPTPRRVAFVRAIMIGREGLDREVVLDLFRAAGAIDPRNHLATGNVSFTSLGADLPGIRGHVEAGIEAIVGRPKPIFVRALDHLERLVDAGPPGGDPACEVVFLPVDAPAVELPLVSRSGRTSVFASNGTELFMTSTPQEAPGALVERVLGRPVTVRAWSTIGKIVAVHRTVR